MHRRPVFALGTLPRTPSRCFHLSLSLRRFFRTEAVASNDKTDNFGSPASKSQTDTFGGGFGGGWSSPTFTAKQTLTEQELKQRQLILGKADSKKQENPEVKTSSDGNKQSPGESRSQPTDQSERTNQEKQSPRHSTERKSPGNSVQDKKFKGAGAAKPQASFKIRRVFDDLPSGENHRRSYERNDSQRNVNRNDVSGAPKSQKSKEEEPKREANDTTTKSPKEEIASELYHIPVATEEIAADVQQQGPSKPKKRRRGRDIDEEYGARYTRDLEDDFETQRRKKKEAKQAKTIKSTRNEPTPIHLPEFISVINLAHALNLHPSDFVQRLLDFGFEEVTYGHVLDAETAGLIASEFNFTPIVDDASEDLVAAPAPEDASNLPSRPPVVTIMGHVDHGKTTILDWLRKSSIAASEHGGITQHIGAFSVPMPSGKIVTFLDTPGHAAFLDMRRRGADVTDIVILVVAADDSVKPQTIEAIKHAKDANVPIIVAINKIDKDSVDVEKVKQDLARHNVHVEDIGGDVQAVCVSGKTGKGMEELEEAAVALSELLDHRADRDGNAEGWVIEGTTKKGGRVATVLVKRGILKPGDIVVAGNTWARVRTLKNEAGVSVKEALPGTPVEVDGWKEQPKAGDEVLEASSEQQAKGVVEYRLSKVESKKMGEDIGAINEARKAELEKRRQEIAQQEGAEVESSTETAESGPQPVNFLVKADVSGSTEAVVNSLSALGNNEVFAKILRSGVGQIGQFDIDYAAISKASIVSFNLSVEPSISRSAQSHGVRIMNHSIIYELIDDVKAQLSEHLPLKVTQHVIGEAEIGQVFDITVKGRSTTSIAGCKVRNGLISRDGKVRVLRNKDIIYEGSYNSKTKSENEKMRKKKICNDLGIKLICKNRNHIVIKECEERRHRNEERD